ncbi:unnamed protein product [Sphagnum tenellum]
MGIVDVKRNERIPKCKHWHWTSNWKVIVLFWKQKSSIYFINRNQYLRLKMKRCKKFSKIHKVQSTDRDKELQLIGKKGQSIEEVNDLLWGYEDDITTKMEALSILCEAVKEEEENLHRELICVCMAQILHNSV